MKPKEGLYHYRFHRGCWIICVYRDVTPTSYTSERVRGEEYFFDREQARKRIYQLNGWNYRK